MARSWRQLRRWLPDLTPLWASGSLMATWLRCSRQGWGSGGCPRSPQLGLGRGGLRQSPELFPPRRCQGLGEGDASRWAAQPRALRAGPVTPPVKGPHPGLCCPSPSPPRATERGLSLHSGFTEPRAWGHGRPPLWTSRRGEGGGRAAPADRAGEASESGVSESLGSGCTPAGEPQGQAHTAEARGDGF